MKYLAIILLFLFGCKKTETENPQPMLCKPVETHHFKIEGATYASQLIYDNKSYSGAYNPLPEFDLKTNEYFQFMDGGTLSERTITIYIDGEILQRWNNADYIIKYEYKIR